MTIVWLDEAERDLAAIVDYVLQDDPTAAWRLVDTIREATRVPSEHPGIGRQGRVEGTRKLVIPGLPYILPYQLAAQQVRTLAVMHTSRKWPDTFR